MVNFVKQHTQSAHTRAEQTEFAQALAKGEVSTHQYLDYLNSKILMCSVMEQHFDKLQLPKSLKRCISLRRDVIELKPQCVAEHYVSPAIEYRQYLDDLNTDDISAHVYVNYLGDLYGGQMIAQNLVQLPTEHLLFNEKAKCIQSVRSIVKQQPWFADEANTAFDWVIRIYEHIGQSHCTKNLQQFSANAQ